MSDFMPTIRIELNYFKEKLTSIIQANDGEVTKLIQETIDNMDIQAHFQAQIMSAANTAIRECIEYYFQCGEGRRTIRNVINTALDDTLNKMLKTEKKASKSDNEKTARC